MMLSSLLLKRLESKELLVTISIKQDLLILEQDYYSLLVKMLSLMLLANV